MLRTRTMCAAVGFLLLVAACGDDSTGPNEDRLLGSWQLATFEANGTPYSLDVVGDVPGQWHFFPDGTGMGLEWWDGELRTEPWFFDWRTEGNQLFFRDEGDTEWEGSITYSATSTKLTVSYQDDVGDDIYDFELTYSRMN
ncbi:hypothetical protein ACFL0I_05250 [Gemmatimonadota bacterium]